LCTLVGQGSRILDAFAQPWRKTAISPSANPGAAIVRWIASDRTRLLDERVKQPNIKIIPVGSSSLPVGKKFDRVLVERP